MVVQWYDQRLNSLATRVRIPLRASGTILVGLYSLGAIAAEPIQPNQRQPSLPSRSSSTQHGQRAEASSPFVRAFCSSCHGLSQSPADSVGTWHGL
jgi:hypothetical protein